MKERKESSIRKASPLLFEKLPMHGYSKRTLTLPNGDYVVLHVNGHHDSIILLYSSNFELKKEVSIKCIYGGKLFFIQHKNQIILDLDLAGIVIIFDATSLERINRIDTLLRGNIVKQINLNNKTFFISELKLLSDHYWKLIIYNETFQESYALDLIDHDTEYNDSIFWDVLSDGIEARLAVIYQSTEEEQSTLLCLWDLQSDGVISSKCQSMMKYPNKKIDKIYALSMDQIAIVTGTSYLDIEELIIGEARQNESYW